MESRMGGRTVILLAIGALVVSAACGSDPEAGQAVGEVAGQGVGADDVGPDDESTSGGDDAGALGSSSGGESIFTEDAPSFCFEFERFGNVLRERGSLPEDEAVAMMLDIYAAMEAESTNPEVVSAVEGLADQLQPALDAYNQSGDQPGDDEEELSEQESFEQLADVLTGMERMQSAEVENSMETASQECLPHQIEPIATTTEELGLRLGGDPGQTLGDGAGSSTDADAAADSAEAEATSGEGSTPEGEESAEPADGAAEGLESAASIELTSADDLVTPSADLIDRVPHRITIDRVFTAATYDDEQASAGQKLVVVEFHMIGVRGWGSTNVSHATFRLEADGRIFNPLNSINEGAGAGDVINDVAIFAVPSEVTALTFEAGPPKALGEGFTATYDVQLQPDPEALAHIEAQRAVPDAEIEATTSSATLTAGDNTVSCSPSLELRGVGQVEILNVTTTRIFENEVSGARNKFVIVDWRMTATERLCNIQEKTMRLLADGELYGPIEGPNNGISKGEVSDFRMVYLVPRDADDLVIQVGAVPSAEEGLWGEFTVNVN